MYRCGMEYGLDVADCVDVTFIWPCSSFTIGKPTDENIFKDKFLCERKIKQQRSLILKFAATKKPKISFIKRDDTYLAIRRCMHIRDVE